MNALSQIKRAECNARGMAEEALSGLSDKAKVNFALPLMMKVTDPDAAGAMHFAGGQITNFSNIMMREAFERECG